MARFEELKANASKADLIAALMDLTPRLTRRVGSLLKIDKRKKRLIIQEIGDYKGEDVKKAITSYNYIVTLRGIKVAKLKNIFTKVYSWASDKDWKEVKSAKDAFKLATSELERFKDD